MRFISLTICILTFVILPVEGEDAAMPKADVIVGVMPVMQTGTSIDSVVLRVTNNSRVEVTYVNGGPFGLAYCEWFLSRGDKRIDRIREIEQVAVNAQTVRKLKPDESIDVVLKIRDEFGVLDQGDYQLSFVYEIPPTWEKLGVTPLTLKWEGVLLLDKRGGHPDF